MFPTWLLSVCALCHCAHPRSVPHLIPESEVDVLEVLVSALCAPLLCDGGLAVLTLHHQHKVTVLAGALVGELQGRDGDSEGWKARVMFTVLLYFPMLDTYRASVRMCMYITHEWATSLYSYASVCLPVCLSLFLFVLLSFCLSLCQSYSLSVCLSVLLSVCVSVCPYVLLSVCLSVGRSVGQSVSFSFDSPIKQKRGKVEY